MILIKIWERPAGRGTVSLIANSKGLPANGVVLETIQTDYLPVLEPHQILTAHLTAAFAFPAVEHPCLLGKLELGFLHIEHLVQGAVEDELYKFLAGTRAIEL